MRDVFVIADNGTRLMPTSRYRARKLLNAGKAVIYKYQPFTIRLSQVSQRNTQPIELCMDTGSEHIGISVKSEKINFTVFDTTRNIYSPIIVINLHFQLIFQDIPRD